jgi:aminomethyltransferase
VKKTAFTDFHIKLGAKMASFAGYNMPIEYSGIKNEHITVREKVGVFDVSHMGEFWVKGEKASDFIQELTSNNVFDLTDNKVQYSCFTNANGGIIDDLLIYKIDNETYMLVVNASNIEKDWEWCVNNAKKKGLIIGKELYNASEEICQLAVQGPLSLKVIQKLTDTSIEDMEYYTFKKCNIAGIEDAIFSTTGYTGSKGCEIYVANEDGPKLWNAIFEAGKEFGIQPIGLGARDTLRIEAGFCLYGNDINDDTSPIQAGLGWITKLTDNNHFIGREIIENQKNNGKI